MMEGVDGTIVTSFPDAYPSQLIAIVRAYMKYKKSS